MVLTVWDINFEKEKKIQSADSEYNHQILDSIFLTDNSASLKRTNAFYDVNIFFR